MFSCVCRILPSTYKQCTIQSESDREHMTDVGYVENIVDWRLNIPSLIVRHSTATLRVELGGHLANVAMSLSCFAMKTPRLITIAP